MRLLGLVKEAREAGDSFTDRGPINAALRVLFDKVVVDYPRKRLVFHWRQGGRSDMLYDWPGD